MKVDELNRVTGQGETGASVPQLSYGQIFRRFLRFGFLAWGGPVAQIAMIRRELVEEEHWVSSASIEWCFVSEGLKQAKGLKFIRKGTPLPSGTITAAFNAMPDHVRTGQRDSGDGRLNDWLEGDRIYRVTEEVVGLGQYGRTLTILTCKSLTLRPEEDDADVDDEDSLVESWTPRFRR